VNPTFIRMLFWFFLTWLIVNLLFISYALTRDPVRLNRATVQVGSLSKAFLPAISRTGYVLAGNSHVPGWRVDVTWMIGERRIVSYVAFIDVEQDYAKSVGRTLAVEDGNTNFGVFSRTWRDSHTPNGLFLSSTYGLPAPILERWAAPLPASGIDGWAIYWPGLIWNIAIIAASALLLTRLSSGRWAWTRLRGGQRHLCPKCGYDRVGTSPSLPCPECGHPA
jgi:hypothetical protein